jgi:ubiquinone/menaquinone biosynthesis C-methylase UbiE
MLTDNKTITTPEYWNNVYSGANNDAKVDASNTKRPANSFDRFSWVAQYAEGDAVLGVGSGHAHIEKRIKAAHPDWTVVASDQAREASGVAKYRPYMILDAYKLLKHYDVRLVPFNWNTIICAQAMEYMADQERFIREAKRVGQHLLITVPIGEMEKWSQLRIYSEESVRTLLQPFGNIKVFERQGDLLLVKLKFND